MKIHVQNFFFLVLILGIWNKIDEISIFVFYHMKPVCGYNFCLGGKIKLLLLLKPHWISVIEIKWQKNPSLSWVVIFCNSCPLLQKGVMWLTYEKFKNKQRKKKQNQLHTCSKWRIAVCELSACGIFSSIFILYPFLNWLICFTKIGSNVVFSNCLIWVSYLENNLTERSDLGFLRPGSFQVIFWKQLNS